MRPKVSWLQTQVFWRWEKTECTAQTKYRRPAACDRWRPATWNRWLLGTKTDITFLMDVANKVSQPRSLRPKVSSHTKGAPGFWSKARTEYFSHQNSTIRTPKNARKLSSHPHLMVPREFRARPRNYWPPEALFQTSDKAQNRVQKTMRKLRPKSYVTET